MRHNSDMLESARQVSPAGVADVFSGSMLFSEADVAVPFVILNEKPFRKENVLFTCLDYVSSPLIYAFL